MKKLILVRPRGFCAGVIRAIETVEKALENFKGPIYVLHPIVHNQHVLENLKRKGAIFVEDLKEVPEKSVLIFSAHGVTPEVRKEAKKRKLYPIDATCGLVAKLHTHAQNFAKKGFFIFLIGNPRHAEVMGVVGEAKEKICVLEKLEDIEKLSWQFEKDQQLAVLTQTTLCQDDAEKMIRALEKKFSKKLERPATGICFATMNRQNALKSILPVVDLVLVVGDSKSANSNRLKEIVLSEKKIPAYLVHDADEILDRWLFDHEVIGMTAGASTPETVVNRCVEKLKNKNFQVEEVVYKKEKVFFPLPKEVEKVL